MRVEILIIDFMTSTSAFHNIQDSFIHSTIKVSSSCLSSLRKFSLQSATRKCLPVKMKRQKNILSLSGITKKENVYDNVVQ